MKIESRRLWEKLSNSVTKYSVRNGNSCAIIINREERENNGRRRECFQTSDDLPWKTLLWWKVNAAVRPRFSCGDHGERPRWGERCWAGKKRDDDYKRTHDFLLGIDANRKSPPVCDKHFLPFTFYQLSSFAGISPPYRSSEFSEREDQVRVISLRRRNKESVSFSM